MRTHLANDFTNADAIIAGGMRPANATTTESETRMQDTLEMSYIGVDAPVQALTDVDDGRRVVTSWRRSSPLAPMSAHVRRRHQRYELLAQVHVRLGTTDYVLGILNLSRGGALIDLGGTPLPQWLMLQRELDVRLLDENGEAVLHAPARIVRIEETRDRRAFAVEFDKPEDDAVIRRVLALAGAPFAAQESSGAPPTT